MRGCGATQEVTTISGPMQLVLMVTPLAAYLYLLAVLQAGRHPRVLGGVADLWLLALGLGGLVVFGPVGDWLAATFFSRPGPLHRLLVALAGSLVVGRLARPARRRLVIYHIDAALLGQALGDLLQAEGFQAGMAGYENPARGSGVRVDHAARWRLAVVEGFGHEAEALIAGLLPRLRARLRHERAVPAEVSLLFFGLSALVMLVPLAGFLLAEPRTRAALRVLLERLHGG